LNGRPDVTINGRPDVTIKAGRMLTIPHSLLGAGR